MSTLDDMDSFCHPLQFWRRDTPFSCRDHKVNETCHDDVDLTLCFQDTVILNGICTALLFLALLEFIFTKRNRRPSVQFSVLNVTKILLPIPVIITALCDLAYTIYERVSHKSPADYQYLSPIVLSIAMVVIILMLLFERAAGLRSSPINFLLWMGLTIYGTLKLRSYILIAEDEGGVSDKLRLGTFCVQYSVFVVEFVLSFLPERKSHFQYELGDDQDRAACPEETATFLSTITFWWQNKQIWYGWRHPLKYDDLNDLCYNDKSRRVAPKFERNWETEVKRVSKHHRKEPKTQQKNVVLMRVAFNAQEAGSGVEMQEQEYQPASSKKDTKQKDPSLFWVLTKTFGGPFFIAGLFKLCSDTLTFASPQILKLMIRYTENDTEADWKGYFYAVLLFAVALVQSLILNHYWIRVFRLGMRIRTAVIAAVYDKALKIGGKARRETTVGEIVNLMSVDAQRLMDLVAYLHIIWSGPFQIILAVIFLWNAVGASVLAGLAVMICLIPFNIALARKGKAYQLTLMTHKDTRTKLVNEVLNGIKVIKLYAWEIPFQRLIMGIRAKELSVLKKSAFLGSAFNFTWTCAPFLVSLTTFATYALVHRNDPENGLTADRVFVALSLFNILRFPLAMIPFLITSVIQASVSMKRLGKYLKSEELDPMAIHWQSEPAMENEDSISVEEASFTWESVERPTLSDLNLSVKPSQLVAVVGQVGAGKSSLTQALLGEMDKLSGSVSVKGKIAYVPQQAWIQNATLQDNILFGKADNEVLYRQTISACALEPDLEVLPGGDETEIGEKGINLSGGQKQRVSLARAVYQNADVYLLDDPLSAVDSHVGKHIFDKVIGPEGMLKGKVRVLVTNGITFLPQCDKIVVMVDGKISEIGPYAELIDNDGAFAEFIRTFTNTQEDEEGDPDSPEHGRMKDGMRKSDSSISDGTINNKAVPTKTIAGKRLSVSKRNSIIQEETAQEGMVKLSVFITYFKACTYYMIILSLLFNALSSGSSIGSNFWLAHWTNTVSGARGALGNITESNSTENENLAMFLGVYASFGVSQAVFILLSTITLYFGAVFASKLLHNKMLKNIMRSPMSFFDTTPLGRILNRFSKDIYVIDDTIPRTLRSFLIVLFNVISTMIVIVIATPMFLVVIIPLGVFYLFIQRLYVATSRQLKRLESVSRSPIYTHFQESITGAASIRAYRQQERFITESERRVDYNQIAYYPSVCANRWLAVRLEFIGNLIVFFAALFSTIERNYEDELNLPINPGSVGLSISYALQVTQTLNWVVRQTSELEANIVAVERNKEYTETPNEAPAVIEYNRPPPDWPPRGHVTFMHYSTRYREGLDLVLKDVNVDITVGTKVGIVGRTGAGKSSLTLALFRIIEPAGGMILIDGDDITEFGLHDLRSKLTIIPQDPVLFSGDLRMNLDPFESYSDEEVWNALEHAHLSNYVSSLAEKLQHPIAEGGENLSVGQRQLVCLARALLRKTKILVLDEATAAVDLETDDLIQKTIRTEFADCTVITIAHRLNTVLDYDVIMVLGAGRIVEYAPPSDLLENKKSIFYSMAKDAGLVA